MMGLAGLDGAGRWVGHGGPSSLDLSGCGGFGLRRFRAPTLNRKTFGGSPIPTHGSGLARQLPSLVSSKTSVGVTPCLV